MTVLSVSVALFGSVFALAALRLAWRVLVLTDDVMEVAYAYPSRRYLLRGKPGSMFYNARRKRLETA